MPNQRYHGLDAWRALLLLMGPVIHAAGLVSAMAGGVGWLDAVGEGSHIFRMEAFFALAGFLAATSQRKGRPDWLKRRVVQLAVPLAFAWAVLLPITDAAFTLCTGQHYWKDVTSPEYLWFLVSLLLFTPLGLLADRRGWVSAMAGRIEQAPGSAFCAAAAVWCAALGVYRLGLHWLLPEQGLLSILLGAPYYGCFYLGGLLVSRTPVLCRYLTVTRAWPIGPLVWATAVAFFYLAGVEGASVGGTVRVTRYLLGGLAAVSMCHTVLATALRTRAASRPVGVLADAAYTIYLVHMPFVGLFAYGLSHAGLSGGALFVGVSVAAMAASLAVHRLIVRRSGLAALLLNGKSPPPRPSLGLAAGGRAQ